MDDTRFDHLTRTLGDGCTRRSLGRLLAGGALGTALAGRGFREEGAAKRKGKQHKRSGRCFGSLPKRCPPTAANPRGVCYPAGAVCCGPALGGGACPPGEACCPPTQGAPAGNCAGVDEVCCSVAGGGGFCPTHLPVCCGPTPADPVPQCIPAGLQCCPFGGFCYANETCCGPSPAFPQGVCAAAGVPCPRGGVAGLHDDGRFAPLRQARSEPRRARPRRS